MMLIWSCRLVPCKDLKKCCCVMNKSELSSQSWNLRSSFIISGTLAPSTCCKAGAEWTWEKGRVYTIEGYNENETERSWYFLLRWMHWFNCGFCISWLPSMKRKCHFFADLWILCKGLLTPLVTHSHRHNGLHSWKHQKEEDFAPTEQDHYCNNPHHSLTSLGLCGHYVRSSPGRPMWLVLRKSGIA